MIFYKPFYLLLAGLLCLTTACNHQDVVVPTNQNKVQLQVNSAANYLRSSCTPSRNQSSPKTECTGGVRKWFGGEVLGDNNVYGGVPWRGHAKDWWKNSKGCAIRTPHPSTGAIVVFSQNDRSWYGHVGIVIGQIDGKWIMKSRNEYNQGQDRVGVIEDYVSRNGGSVLGYLIYSN